MEIGHWLKIADVESLEEARSFLALLPPEEGEARYYVELATNFYKTKEIDPRRLRLASADPSLWRGYLYRAARAVRLKKNKGLGFTAPSASLVYSQPGETVRRFAVHPPFVRISGGSYAPRGGISLGMLPECPLGVGPWAEIDLEAGLFWLRTDQLQIPVCLNQHRIARGFWHPLADETLVRFGQVHLTFEVKEAKVGGKLAQLSFDL